MRLEIDIPEHHYNNIMAIDSVCIGRAPYKGIIMYAINAIKHGKVLEQEPTTKNDLEVDYISRQVVIDLMMQKWGENFSGDSAMQESIDAIRVMPLATPQEPKTGHWIKHENPSLGICMRVSYECSCCGVYQGCENFIRKSFCPNCGAKMAETEETEHED